MSDDIQSIRRTSWTAVDLLAEDFPEERYAVPGILPEGLSLVVSPPKLGKSWAMLNCAIAVASGGRALGQVPVEQGEVLFLALEDGPRRLKRRLEMVLGDAQAPDGLFFETEWPPFDAGGLDDLRIWLSNSPAARLVVIDVIARLRSPIKDKADRYMADYMMAEGIKAVADEYGIAIAGVHHTRKQSADDFLETVSGTNGLAGCADSVLVMKRARGKADASLHITGRDIEERELALSFSPEVGTWTLLGDAAEYAMGETRQAILEAIRLAGVPMSPRQITEELDRDHELVKKTCQRMARDGQIKVARRGWYELPPDTASLPETLSLPSPSPQEGSGMAPSHPYRDTGTEGTRVGVDGGFGPFAVCATCQERHTYHYVEGAPICAQCKKGPVLAETVAS